MGVSGCGKSTVGGVLHGRVGWPLCEGDDLHPPANVAKMAAGHALTDEDRRPWLALVRAWIDARVAADGAGLVTCSALKRAYRDVLREPHVVFVHLDGTREQLLARLAGRHGHFMPAALLDSQLATLEKPDADEQAIRVDIAAPAAVQANEIVDILRL
ncbi:gluconokinase [uncultured Jatrophihabitans sp.]|uniref:gluconokinase n=1 Tax=uncultured Jatrophihabitans sp. TaxID=1610747 RepID=UPI0035C9733C